MSKRFSRQSLIASMFAFFVIASVIFVPYGQVSARVWDGRAFRESYFQRLYNKSLQGYGWLSESYVLQGGLYTYNVNDFMNRLIAKNRGGSGTISQKRDVAGSAFLVHALLGRNGDQANASGQRSISDADFAALRARLEALESAGRINWNTTVCANGTNTLAMGIPAGNAANRQVDVLRSSYNGCEAGVSMIDDNGNEFKIFHRCANPVGDPPSLSVAISNFNLTPTMGLNKTSAEGGEQVTLDPAVTNSGTTASTNVEWRATTFRLNPGVATPTGGVSATAPIPYFGNNAVDVQAAQSRTFPRGAQSLASSVGPQQIGDFPVGTKVCYALSVRPYTHTDANSWRHSTPACVVIAKKPKVQVLGGDLLVGKNGTANVVTSSSVKTVNGTARTFGSWGEYGILASGEVTAMASGAAYSGGAEVGTTCAVSILTFSNVRAGATSCVNGNKPGGYTNVRALPDVGSRLVAQTQLGANPTVNIASTATGSYGATGTVNLSSSQAVPRGKWVVINAPTATVNITSNIDYTNDTLNSLTDIPQVIIIANRITIAASVTRVDAWLVATGTQGSLSTCSDVTAATNLTSNVCNQQLTVNGPVIARHIYLYRTAGSDGTSSGVSNAVQAGRPAEVFNLRPDAYLWATGYDAGAGRLQTMVNTELPPRF